MDISSPIDTASRLQATFTAASSDGRDARGAGRTIHATFSLDPELHRRLKLTAAMKGVTMSDMVSSWIEWHCPPV